MAISGTDFVSGATVTFAGAAATVGAVTSTSITVTTPAGAAGAADVVVTNPDNQSSTLTGGFTYVPPPPTAGSSVYFAFNDPSPGEHDYAQQLVIPPGFGDAEFTFEMWVKLDNSFPSGSVSGVSDVERQTNWAIEDGQPYSSDSWWFDGNFLLDGHNNNAFALGTFDLQIVGDGRLRWLFGDGDSSSLPGGVWGIQAYPSSTTSTLLDGNWHQITLVRRWSGTTQADLEMWIDGSLIAIETSTARTSMRQWWDSWTDFPGGQEGWFYGAEKQAAIGNIPAFEDYKGLTDEIRFWNRAKTTTEIANDYDKAIVGGETGLLGHYDFSEGTGNDVCDNLNPSDCITLINMKPGFWVVEDPPLVTVP